MTELARRLADASNLEVRAMPVVWLTDIDVRSRADAARIIGLRAWYRSCDPVAFRFRVPALGVSTWAEWAEAHPELVTAEYRRLLEAGCEPDRWWVGERELPGARLDHRYRPPAS